MGYQCRILGRPAAPQTNHNKKKHNSPKRAKEDPLNDKSGRILWSRTLHGVQGKTADPGFIANWKFPKGLKKQSIWLAYYVSLSRPRGFSRLLSHGLPDRSIIEGGPPGSITESFDELLAGKAAATKAASACARAEMGWPARTN